MTLEGISLNADEDYSLIKSCFPYVAKRLLNDSSDRAQTALRDLLYGAGNFVSGDRLVDLSDGLSTFVTTTRTIPQKYEDKRDKSVADTANAISLVKDTADVLLSSEGNLIQNIFINETASVITASAKDLLQDVLIDRPMELRKQIPFLPPPLFGFAKPFFAKTEEEAKAQELAQKLSNQLDASPQQEVTLEQMNGILNDVELEQVALVLKELRENLPKYSPLLNKFGEKFAATVARKSREDFERTFATMRRQTSN